LDEQLSEKALVERNVKSSSTIVDREASNVYPLTSCSRYDDSRREVLRMKLYLVESRYEKMVTASVGFLVLAAPLWAGMTVVTAVARPRLSMVLTWVFGLAVASLLVAAIVLFERSRVRAVLRGVDEGRLQLFKNDRALGARNRWG
jgi:hypothetical protein